MRKLVIALAVLAASCSGGDADTTTAPTTAVTTTTSAVATTTTVAETTTTSPSTTTTTTSPPFATFTHQLFTLSYPPTWSEDPDFPSFGVGFIEEHTAQALPATRFSVSLEEQEAGFDLDAHIQRVQDELAFFVPDFRVLHSGEEDLDGARSLWFEYSEEFEGFQLAIREQVALRDNLLVTISLISPVEYFDFDNTQAGQAIESFRFS
jgi:hypothetical protein